MRRNAGAAGGRRRSPGGSTGAGANLNRQRSPALAPRIPRRGQPPLGATISAESSGRWPALHPEPRVAGLSLPAPRSLPNQVCAVADASTPTSASPACRSSRHDLCRIKWAVAGASTPTPASPACRSWLHDPCRINLAPRPLPNQVCAVAGASTSDSRVACLPLLAPRSLPIQVCAVAGASTPTSASPACRSSRHDLCRFKFAPWPALPPRPPHRLPAAPRATISADSSLRRGRRFHPDLRSPACRSSRHDLCRFKMRRGRRFPPDLRIACLPLLAPISAESSLRRGRLFPPRRRGSVRSGAGSPISAESSLPSPALAPRLPRRRRRSPRAERQAREAGVGGRSAGDRERLDRQRSGSWAR